MKLRASRNSKSRKCHVRVVPDVLAIVISRVGIGETPEVSLMYVKPLARIAVTTTPVSVLVLRGWHNALLSLRLPRVRPHTAHCSDSRLHPYQEETSCT